MVDDLNPMLNFTRKEVENLLHFVEKEPAPQASLNVKGIKEPVLQLACLKYPHLITKVRVWDACNAELHPFPAREPCLASLFSSSELPCHAGNTDSSGSSHHAAPTPIPSLFLPVLRSATWKNLASVFS